jgi:hypothetical protein
MNIGLGFISGAVVAETVRHFCKPQPEDSCSSSTVTSVPTRLFIGPSLLSGIGQVTKQYARNFGEYVEYSKTPRREHYEIGFAFVLPVPEQLALVDALARRCTRMIYMTICETEPVSPAYGLLEKYGTIYTASEFCRQIFQRQFPGTTWKLLRHCVNGPTPIVRTPYVAGTPYVFYTIGNVQDPRKNITGMLEAFVRCKFKPGEAELLIKATCAQEVRWKFPGVRIINGGVLSDAQMEDVHAAGHCYVNCSHSEGVGMGAAEAAARNKPVIIADYGGLKEYVRTPYVVKCSKGPVGFDDFLYTRELEWGHPSTEELTALMVRCFTEKVHFAENGLISGLVAEVESDLLSM